MKAERSELTTLLCGTRVLIDGETEARLRQVFPNGSSSYAFPHVKLDIVDGDENVAVHIDRSAPKT